MLQGLVCVRRGDEHIPTSPLTCVDQRGCATQILSMIDKYLSSKRLCGILVSCFAKPFQMQA